MLITLKVWRDDLTRVSNVIDVGSVQAQGTFLACTTVLRRLPSVWFRFLDALRSIIQGRTLCAEHKEMN